MVEPSKARVRFAPSPTGMMHIGGVRTALFNWLLAQSSHGQFILRVEDTDRNRYDPKALDSIKNALSWLGLQWDEGPDVGGQYGPYVQSERAEVYKHYEEKIVASGSAYYCDCSPERLEEVRAQQRSQKLPPGYDEHCRDRAVGKNENTVLRFAVPHTGKISFQDAVHGNLSFDLGTISDFVILKSDGMPTYHFAHVVDDYAMNISHVIRGEEWISSVPKHLLIQQSLNFEAPIYVHVPLLLGKDRSKLSKRNSDVAFESYVQAGYLPDAIVNYLALLGWSTTDDVEIMSRTELIAKFSIERIQKHPAIFDQEKLNWLNGQYIRKTQSADLAQMLVPFLEKPYEQNGLPNVVNRPIDLEYLRLVVECVQERIETLRDVPATMAFFFTEDVKYDPQLLIKSGETAESTVAMLRPALNHLRNMEDFTAAKLEAMLRALADELKLKTGQLFYPIRIAISGSKISPPLFDTMHLVGTNRVIVRINNAISALKMVGN